jgi:hypothetical protein
VYPIFFLRETKSTINTVSKYFEEAKEKFSSKVIDYFLEEGRGITFVFERRGGGK